ncbi:MAG TPA: MerR family transcriptional regulator [Gaiellales bacterium]|jgi:DNA-binding transcriptional MerR regulator|nr:MerR family transcriptional regulator [Gaiellales bacterium]
MAAAAESSSYRIGEVAERVGVTPRTIRYYEELGLLVPIGDRRKGAHRLYDAQSIARLQQLFKLRDLLGLSLETIVTVAEAEEASAAVRDTLASDASEDERLRMLDQAHPLLLRQIELVRQGQRTLARFSQELRTLLRSIEEARAGLTGSRGSP